MWYQERQKSDGHQLRLPTPLKHHYLGQGFSTSQVGFLRDFVCLNHQQQVLVFVEPENDHVRKEISFLTGPFSASRLDPHNYGFWNNLNQFDVQGPPIMGPPYPYYSHTTPIRIPKDMGIVGKLTISGSHYWESLESPLTPYMQLGEDDTPNSK